MPVVERRTLDNSQSQTKSQWAEPNRGPEACLPPALLPALLPAVSITGPCRQLIPAEPWMDQPRVVCVHVWVPVCVCVCRGAACDGEGNRTVFRVGVGVGIWTHVSVNPVALGKCTPHPTPPPPGFPLTISKVITGFTSSFTRKTNTKHPLYSRHCVERAEQRQVPTTGAWMLSPPPRV